MVIYYERISLTGLLPSRESGNSSSDSTYLAQLTGFGELIQYIMVDVSLDFSKKQLHKSRTTVIYTEGKKGVKGKISPLAISAHSN